MGGAPRGAGVVFTPPMSEGNRCTPSLTVSVPLRGRPARPRPGKAVVTLAATGGGRARDIDRVRLLCLPGR